MPETLESPASRPDAQPTDLLRSFFIRFISSKPVLQTRQGNRTEYRRHSCATKAR